METWKDITDKDLRVVESSLRDSAQIYLTLIRLCRSTHKTAFIGYYQHRYQECNATLDCIQREMKRRGLAPMVHTDKKAINEKQKALN